MNNNQNNEILKSTLEKIRAAKCPEIPQDLISQIIDVQTEYQDNDQESKEKILEVIQKYLPSNNQ